MPQQQRPPGRFYGKTLRTIDAGTFRFTEKLYSPELSIPDHSHELPHFCYVLSGCYREQIGRRIYDRQASHFMFYCSGIAHREEHGREGRHFLVEIDSEEIDRVRQCGARLDGYSILESPYSQRLVQKIYHDFCFNDRFSRLAIESMAIELLVAVSREELSGDRRAPKWLKHVKARLREDIASPPLLRELAEEVGVHSTHVARVFRRFEKCTAGEYMRKVRVDRAIELLAKTRKPLAEIALDCGFADQSHFSRTFKRSIGMTPSEYRRQAE